MKRRAAPMLVLLPFLLGVERPPGLGDVVEVRHWSYPAYTRVVVELSRPAASAVRLLPPSGGRPARLYVDLPGIWVGRRYPRPLEVGDGLLQDVRLGQNTLSKARLVLDLQRYGRHRQLVLRHPNRVVIDVYAPVARRAAPATGSRMPLDVRGVRTVVLDPGHGGKDPGAIGVGGIREKDVTLDLARRLRPRLETRGFRVVLTRNTDRFLSLEERTALAAGSGGDVFVSLHANAARRRSAHGVETYFLDASNQRQSIRVAARENGMAPSEFDQFDRTLVRMRLAENSRYSERLAGLIQSQVVQRVGRRFSGVEDHGVKRGPFYVLFLSSMPSVLFESGFVTHFREGRRLRNPAYLDEMAESIARAVASYRSHVGTVVARGQR